MPEQTVLSNGLYVLTDSMPQVQTVSVVLRVKVGSRHEADNQNGISHFLEHMAFKGTKTRTAKQIAEEFDAIGGVFNAYTSREFTVYYAKVLKEDLTTAVDILADIVQNSTFAEDELEKERNVILQEIAQTNDTPDDIIFDHHQATAYPDQPLGRSILGTPELVSAFTREDLNKYVNDNYHGNQLYLSAAGYISHEQFVNLAKTHFADLPKEVVNHSITNKYQGGENYTEKDLEQIHYIMSFPGYSYMGDEHYTQHMLASILGGSMSSRLFQEIREKHGLAYSVYAFASAFEDCGTFGVYAGAAPEEVEKLVPLLCQELFKAAENITTEEIDRAKTQVKAGLLMGMESTQFRAETLGRDFAVYDRYISIDEVLEKINAINGKQLQDMMGTILECKEPTISALGKLQHLESYETTVARLI